MDISQQLSTSFREFVAGNSDRASNVVETFIFEPESDHERSLGHMFIVAESTVRAKSSVEVMHGIVEVAQEMYYAKETKDMADGLERAINKINGILGDLATSGITRWVGNLSLVMLVARDTDVLFAGCGKVHVFLVRDKETADLATQLEPTPANGPNPLRVFTSLVTGNVAFQDKVVLTTDALLGFVPKEQLHKIVRRFHPEQTVRHLQSAVSNHKNQRAFGAIVIEAGIPKVPKIALTTEELVATPTTPETATATEVASTAAAPALAASLRTTLAPIAKRGIAALKIGSATLLAQAKKISAALVHRIRTTQKRSTPNAPHKLRTHTRDQQGMKKIWSLITFWWQQLTLTQRLIGLGLLIVLTGILIGFQTHASNVRATNEKNHIMELQTQAESAVAEARIAIDQNDDAKAKRLLREAENTIATVNTSTYATNESRALPATITQLIEKSNRQVVLPGTKTIGDFSSILEDTSLLTSLTFSNNTWVATSNERPYLYQLLANGSATKIKPDRTIGNIQAQTVSSGNIFAITNTPALAMYTAADKIFDQLDGEIGDVGDTVVGMGTYGGRIYALDPDSNKIWRIETNDKGIATTTSWITDATNVRNGVAMTIDGSIYVLQKDGSVVKLTRGKADTFALHNLTNPLQGPTAIATAEGWKNIYILDPASKRVVQFDKTGTLVQQYTFADWTNLRGMAIDETGKHGFVLNNNTVQQFDLTL